MTKPSLSRTVGFIFEPEDLVLSESQTVSNTFHDQSTAIFEQKPNIYSASTLSNIIPEIVFKTRRTYRFAYSPFSRYLTSTRNALTFIHVLDNEGGSTVIPRFTCLFSPRPTSRLFVHLRCCARRYCQLCSPSATIDTRTNKISLTSLLRSNIECAR